MRAFIACGLAAAVLAPAGAAGPKPEPVEAKALVGRWSPKEPPKGAVVVVEFADGGKLAVTATFGGQTEKLAGTYALAGDKLTIVLADAGKERKETLTVVRAAADELVTRDEKGKEETLVRAKDKK